MAPHGLLTVRVPAKVNLFLAVRGVRPDGFHELVTVLQTVSLHDLLRVGVDGPPGRGHHPAARRRMLLELLVDGTPGVPADGDNLALKAARALGRAVGVSDLNGDAEGRPRMPRTVIDLRKGIPVAGGMAGGSADAAGTLVALNELWGANLSRERLKELAAEIGSDVPFCVDGGTALATGRGTAVAQVLCRGAFHWVIGRSARPLSTAAVYQAWDRLCTPSEVEPDAVLAALGTGDAEALGAALHNDLEPAAFALRPELVEQAAAMRDAGAVGVVLSGSGPTMLALAADARVARTLADRLRGDFDEVTVAHSPADGPELDR